MLNLSGTDANLCCIYSVKRLPRVDYDHDTQRLHSDKFEGTTYKEAEDVLKLDVQAATKWQ